MAERTQHIGIITLCIILVAGALLPAAAGVRSQAAREGAEYILRKFSQEVGQETVETLTEKLTRLGVRHGDEAIDALRRVGPRGFRIIADAGEHAADAVQLLTKFGDEAAWMLSQPKGMAYFLKYGDDGVRALITHRAVAEPIVERFGAPAVRALTPLSPQNGRRLAILVEEGAVIQGSQAAEVLKVIAQGGDQAMEFIWKHKGALTVSAVLATFLTQPALFIDGTRDLAEVVTRPVTEAGKEVAGEIGRRTNWTVVMVAAMGLCTAFFAGKRWLENRV